MTNEDNIILIKKTMYAYLVIAWVIFLTPIPFIIILGLSLNSIAFLLSIICICRHEEVKHSLIILTGSTIISPIIAIIGQLITYIIIGSSLIKIFK